MYDTFVMEGVWRRTPAACCNHSPRNLTNPKPRASWRASWRASPSAAAVVQRKSSGTRHGYSHGAACRSD